MAQRFWEFQESLANLFRTDVPTVVQTPQSYLGLARKCMEKAQEMTSTSLQLNRALCEYLVYKLKVAIPSAEWWAQLNSTEFNSECVEIMKLLWRTAKEVESFIQGCCNDNWIQAAIVKANMSSYVSLLGSNLDFCMLLLHNVNNTVGAVPNWEKHLDALSTLKSIKEKVSRDQSNLLVRLESVILSSNSSDQECQLAKCLSGRLRQHLSGSVQLNVWDIDFSSLRQVQRLGSGSAAMVYKSIWLTGKIEVAEKMFYGSDHPSFKNEVEVLAGLTHPNIVPLLGYAMDESKCSIAMELMDGDLLFLMEARLRENRTCKFPFTNFEAVDMMHQTAEGMLYLHENKVVHRDLKSQNILVKSRKDIDAEYVFLKVADFGLSKTKENSITYSNQTLNTGTTRWMAPELMTTGAAGVLFERMPNRVEDLSYPFKVDVYSFGMVCYEILTGKVPFWTIHSLKEVKKMVLNGDRPVLPDQCPDSLKTLIHSCWESEPSSRPSFVEICKRLRHLKYFLMTGQDRKKFEIPFTKRDIEFWTSSSEPAMPKYYDGRGIPEGVAPGDVFSSRLFKSPENHLPRQLHNADDDSTMPTTTVPTTMSTSMPITMPSTMPRVFTMADCENHRHSEDCWLVIDGKVYDVTQFLDKHPGGEEVILEVAGRDATDDFNDIEHSKDALAQMAEYLIGDISGYIPADMWVRSPTLRCSKSRWHRQLRRSWL